jgi:hypothetical protein
VRVDLCAQCTKLGLSRKYTKVLFPLLLRRSFGLQFEVVEHFSQTLRCSCHKGQVLALIPEPAGSFPESQDTVNFFTREHRRTVVSERRADESDGNQVWEITTFGKALVDITNRISYIPSCKGVGAIAMAVMSIRIKEQERKLLKVLASLEGRTMTEVVSELLGEYVRKRQAQLNRSGQPAEVRALMKLSEPSFAEWDNKDDDIYDSL